MADNKVEKTELPQIEKDKKVDDKKEEADAKCEKPERVENGDVKETEENGQDAEKEEEEEAGEKTCVKRKSAGGDAPDGTPAEGATPEKKQKLDEPAEEADSKGEAEVAA